MPFVESGTKEQGGRWGKWYIGPHLLRQRENNERDLTGEQKRALDEFAQAMNDHDPRARLLRDASAGFGKVREA